MLCLCLCWVNTILQFLPTSLIKIYTLLLSEINWIRCESDGIPLSVIIRIVDLFSYQDHSFDVFCSHTSITEVWCVFLSYQLHRGLAYSLFIPRSQRFVLFCSGYQRHRGSVHFVFVPTSQRVGAFCIRTYITESWCFLFLYRRYRSLVYLVIVPTSQRFGAFCFRTYITEVWCFLVDWAKEKKIPICLVHFVLKNFKLSMWYKTECDFGNKLIHLCLFIRV